MTTAAAQLLCCSLVVFGALSLWCVGSSRHWFLRCSVFLAALLPVLLIPAYEPAVAFVIQGAVVCIGHDLARRSPRFGSRPKLLARFGITAMLQGMVLLAVTVAVGVKLPRLNIYAWCNVVGVGVVAGLWTCVANWIVNGKWRNAILRLIVGLFITLLVAIPISLFDTTLNSFAVGWPASPDSAALLGFLGAIGGKVEAYSYWIPLALGVTTGLAGFLWLFARIKDSKGKLFWLWIGLLGVFSLPVLAPPLQVLVQLLNPTPFPELVLPKDNGYEDLFAAGKIADNWDFNGAAYGSDEAPINELKSAVAEMTPAYELLERGLAKPVQYPLVSFDPAATFEGLGELRSLARASIGRGRLASRNGDFERACACHIQTIQFGHGVRRQGLWIQHLVGMACSGMGHCALYEVKERLLSDTCLDVVSKLWKLELDVEPFEDIVRRDEAWTQRAYGWHGHLGQILQEVAGEEPNNSFRDAVFRELATMRLLRIEFALTAFQKETGKLPQKLSQLVPRYVKEVPVDPYSEAGDPFQYRIFNEKFVLYSLGADRDDDGGILPEDYTDSAWNWGVYSEGDLRLKYRFAPEPAEVEEPENSGDGYQPYDYSDEGEF